MRFGINPAVADPNSPLRPHVTAWVKNFDGVSDTPLMVPATRDEHTETRHLQPVYLWAMLIARLYELFPLECPICGYAMRIIVFVTEAAAWQ